ncbi:MAG: hypothetical protein MMC23_003007 [Stictis urceolatum]|nr:hypothetical protein [Stictis urceolata]
MSKQSLLKHYHLALSRWPKDTLRPDTSFSASMQSRITRRFGLAPSANPSSSKPSTSSKSSPESPQTTPPPPLDEAAELEQVNALYSFLEDRYSKRYPLSQAIMSPRSNPAYYRDLMAEIEQSQQRSRFQQWLHTWKGFFRWQ